MPKRSTTRKRVSPAEESKEESSSTDNSNNNKRARRTVEIPSALDIGQEIGTQLLVKQVPQPTAATAASKKQLPPKPTDKRAAKKKPPPAAAAHAHDSVAPQLGTDLNETEARLWQQSYAAKCASHNHNPGRKVRLVGTITRTVTVDHAVDPLPSMKWNLKGKKRPQPYQMEKRIPATFKVPTVNQAKKEILRDWPADQDITEGQLVLQANILIQEWKQLLNQPYASGWDQRGELLDCPLEGSLRVSQVLALLQDGVLTDSQPDLERDFYHGLRTIAIDTQTVLTSISNYATPGKALYGQPMVVAYVLPNLINTAENQKTYRLTIPVYVHRLAFEILSLEDVHTIWGALDEESYTVLTPLNLPPKVDQVFFSAPTPRVVMDSDDEDDDEKEEETDSHNSKQKMTDDVEEDILLGASTRRSDVVSAYTFPGFLKLLESPGCNVASWPAIEARLRGKLQIELLPHQKHAICWQIQQECLDGGLNSLLWEERQFADGNGSYFFSPACGQIRLWLGGNGSKNVDTGPAPVGGILADEMGLGKTVTLLALVLATKDDENSSDDEPTTLIIVPPALLTQWKAEIKKVAGTHLRTQVFDADSLSFTPAFEGESAEGNVDICLTTYAALSNAAPARKLRSYSWKRIVLDEMQEIRSSTTQLAKNCQDLSGHRRWMLSGTPLFESIEDFRGELCFLGLEPFAATSEDGFFDFLIKSHWDAQSHFCIATLRCLSLVMLRRSKAMTYMDPIQKERLPLLGLPPLTVTFEPVPSNASERAAYCFLEYLVHSNFGNENKEGEAKSPSKADEGKRQMFIKLLRESCLSLHILTGGLGCPTRLDTLDRIMIQHHRRSGNNLRGGSVSARAEGVISTEEAVEFLSRVIDSARVDEGFHTTQTVGGGFGRSRRDRAYESAEARLAESESILRATRQAMNACKSRRAKARWHQALEMLTMGHLECGQARNTEVHKPIRTLWRWRRLVGQLTGSNKSLPNFLCRGWRPTAHFFRCKSFYRARDSWRRLLRKVVQGEAFRDQGKKLKFGDLRVKENRCKYNGSEASSDDDSTTKEPAVRHSAGSRKTRKYHALWRWRFLFKHAAEREGGSVFPGLVLRETDDRMLLLKRLSKRFRWASPYTLLLEDIPRCVPATALRHSIIGEQSPGLEHSPSETVAVFPLNKSGDSWKAYVQFKTSADFANFFAKTKKRDGVALPTDKPLPWIRSAQEEATERLKDAKAASKVYPCDDNIRKVHEAKRSKKLAELGLRMHCAHHREGHVKVTRTCPHIRSDRGAANLLEICRATIEDSGEDLDRQQSIIAAEERKVKLLERGSVSREVQNLSTFEILEALKNGEREKTSCPVCLCPLGDEQEGRCALTRCGHLFCTTCLDDYFKSKEREGQHSPSCIACRKAVRRDETVIVDPSLNDDEANEEKRSAARSLVRELAEKLENSNGHIEPSLWEAMYLSFDVPLVSKARNPTYTAIPGELLAHLRQATGLALTGRKVNAIEALESNLSSKIRKLIDDIPRNERCVVFATSASSVKHILCVLEQLDRFPVLALYSGQAEPDSKGALDFWRSTPAGVLLVQAGAAACGLTLTDASKMFIMEPFHLYEQELQAYSRLHRYGQQSPVDCKVYFRACSVEERLLEWRKKEKSSETPDEHVVFAQLKSTDDDDNDDIDGEEDITQTRYLLGLDYPEKAAEMEE